MGERFETIILIGRPAAGKSEVIDFLKKTDERTRAMRFHIGPFVEIDDFPFVWETFEIDDLLEALGQPRVFTTKNYYFKGEHLWNLFIGRINLEFRKRLARDPDFTRKQTVVVEFSRGGESGFAEALDHLADEILSRAGMVYINVSYEESARKNRRRFDPAQADSILFHSLPDEKMEFYYKTNDWEQLSGGQKSGRIRVRSFDVPFAVFDNEPEKTDDPKKLGPALEDVFGRLWDLMHSTQAR
ncbi:MAG TPA: hypothetical protein VMT21_10505 [Gemmatimonadales bacterium]|nr:hypothetical protein [Gemmatimonadales bacterium]